MIEWVVVEVPVKITVGGGEVKKRVGGYDGRWGGGYDGVGGCGGYDGVGGGVGCDGGGGGGGGGGAQIMSLHMQ